MKIRTKTATQYAVEDVPAAFPAEPAGTGPGGLLAHPGAAPSSAPTTGTKPVAVFVAHGMGQQLPFATLDQAASGLSEALARRGHAHSAITASAQSVHLGDVRTPGVVMTVEDRNGQLPSPPPIHLFEGYWAPLTEGQVTLRDVMRFLVRGAWNGLRKGVGQPIERYMFGRRTVHAVPSWTFVSLLVAALALGSLVLLNAVVVAVVTNEGYDVLTEAPAADSTPTAQATASETAPPADASPTGETTASGSEPGPQEPVLPRTLTALAAGYLAVTLAFGGLLALCMVLARPTYRRTYKPEGPGPYRRVFYGAVFVTFFGWLLATLFVGLGTVAALVHAAGFVPSLPEPRLLWIAGGCALAVALAAGGVSAGHGSKVLRAYETHAATYPDDKKATRRPLAGLPLFAVTFFLVAAAVTVLACAVALLAPWSPRVAESATWADARAFRVGVWFSLFGVSAVIRMLLVQYLGDVAAYVSPHTLDRFASLRRAIREASEEVLRGVYHARDPKTGEPLYGGVAVVGHSLGSVVAYDALNRVLTEDAAAEEVSPGSGVEVQRRTRLLLTFGSPLDKTAYIFRAQNTSLSDVREALAAAVQPLILKAETRTFPWVNVHSSRDVIGSKLDLYDMPPTKRVQSYRADRHRRKERALEKEHDLKTVLDELALSRSALDGKDCPFCVHDVADPGARVPLVAHNEHWKTRAVFDVLAAALLPAPSPGGDGGAPGAGAAPGASHPAVTAGTGNGAVPASSTGSP